MSTPIPPSSSPAGTLPEPELIGGTSATFLGHPIGLFLLFLVEMWERFSYYGMRALLVLYLISVMAVHQLQPGSYTNTVEFTQMRVVEGKSPEKEATKSIALHVLVGQPPSTQPDAATPPIYGQPSFVLKPVVGVRDPNDGSKMIWTPDAARADGPLVVRGEKGGKGAFTPGVFAYEISNPTDAPIELQIGIKRDKPDSPTYFTVNDSSGVIVADIMPDSKRAEGDEPYRVTIAVNEHDSGRNWTKSEASVLYGWYTGLAYLLPILGGIIADKLIGTHRSMLVGGMLISLGHIVLGISGFGALAHDRTGLSLFIMGLALIILGTGHFKPTVSVMVGQLYKQGDPRRDGAFSIFYMGINLGAFLCAFVCGTLGEKVGWHWGFGSAAVGMIAGLLLYMWGKPRFLKGIGDAPKPNPNGLATKFFLLSFGIAAVVAVIYFLGAVSVLTSILTALQKNPILGWGVVVVMALAILGWVIWFLIQNRPEDRGPVITIFIFMLFNAVFWIAFEQAGSSVNVFTEQNTNRFIGGFEVPATWFQSVNAGLIILMAAPFGALWTKLGRMNPPQPVKIALGLIFVGVGYLFMVWAGAATAGGAAKASMFLVLAMYFWHTVGELCLSPTGLSYVTKAAPVRFVSLLMGIWFVSSFIANLGGGLLAAQVEAIERGELKLPWNFGGKADFFFLFVVSSIGAGVLILVLTPILRRMMRNPND